VSLDATTLVAGVVVALLGVYSLLEAEGTIDLSLGWAAVAVTAALGVLFLLSGLAPGRGDSQDQER
jgi:hypothetical protein